ncbi:hypothetical protein FRC08_002653 [Ceratobasidium sp. 394]|nr:hypothetical protein FRC08_002653 [Ceratobasidium sp. 394]KAG9084718.1 hypothetical protein FS749_005008 [Ceratobasidium sp. UAMH 11750]
MFSRASRRAALALKRLPSTRGRVLQHLGDFAYTCPYCSVTVKTRAGRDRHVELHPYCRARRLRELSGYVSKYLKKKQKQQARTEPETPAPTRPKRPRSDSMAEDEDEAARPQKQPRTDTLMPEPDTPVQPPIPGPANDPSRADKARNKAKRSASSGTSRGSFVEEFPIPTAGAPVSSEKKGRDLSKEDLRDYLASCGKMGEPAKFEVAELLATTGLTAQNRTKYLRSGLCRGKGYWRNNRKLMQDIDRLPSGPKWTTETITVGEGIHESTHIVFRRDIVEVIKDLMGDPRFKRFMRYAPERHWSSHERECRLYGEMWSGNWWWRMQYLIRDPNGTIAPIIIASDKTSLSTMSGGQQAYPVYLTIGNISKSIRRKPSKRATVVIGYLPVDSFKDVKSVTLRKQLRGKLLHRSMEAIFEPLKTASRDGVPMWCADGYLRHVYPILAAFVGDWPEQNDVSCTVRSGCPVCRQGFHGRGSGKTDAPMRNQEDTVAAYQAFARTNNKAELCELNLKPWKPFWADLPHVDFPSCITPDILHQLHKGVFKDYIAEWTEGLLGKDVLDGRFMAMPQAKNLRHFKKGITSVQQWTGRETKEMVKQYLPIIANDPKVPDAFVKLVRALLEFLHLAERAQLTASELDDVATCSDP